MDQTFIKDPLHRMESLIWSSHKLRVFYSYSNYKLKIYVSVRKKYHVNQSAGGTLEIVSG